MKRAETRNFIRVDKNLYRRGGTYYRRTSTGGRPRWQSLRTNDLAQARIRLAQAEAGVPVADTNGAADDRITKLEAMLQQILAAQHSTFNPSADGGRPPLPEALDAFLRTRPTKSRHTRAMYQACRDLVLAQARTWEDLERLGPFEVWHRSTDSPGRRNHLRAFLTAFGKYALEETWLTDPKKFSTQLGRIRKEKVDSRVLEQVSTPEEVERLFAQVESMYPGGGRFCEFLAYTGARLEGALTATWAGVDRQYRWIRLTEKGEKTRAVPLNPKAVELLKGLADGSLNPKPEKPRGRSARKRDKARTVSLEGAADRRGRIFPWMTENRAWYLRNVLKQACALLDSPLVTFHLLRHWFVSQATQQGVPANQVAAWAGHADGGLLILKTYAHLTDEGSYEKMQQIRL